MARAGGGSGWRKLGVAWAVILVACGAGAGTLQYLGPPRDSSSGHAAPAPPDAHAPPVAPPHGQAASPAHGAAPATPTSHGAEVATAAPHGGEPAPAHGEEASATAPPPPRAAPGTIPAPDPELLEPAPDFRGAKLPRIGPAGRVSMRYYARSTDPADKRPRVAVLVAGFGLSDGDSRAAIASLPPAVSLGVSPYSHDPEPMLAEARARGHEFFVTLPMESQGYPLNNSGVHALMTGVDPNDNDRNLEWVLSRMQGEVGLTGASDGLRGERFAAATAAMAPVLKQVSDRGLMYVDPRPMAPPGKALLPGPVVTVTVVVDDVQDPAEIDARLQELESRARDSDRVVGLVGRVRPVTMERVANWARGLDGRGLALVPVSAMLPRNPPK